MPSSVSEDKTCARSEENTSELQSHDNLVCRLLLEKKTITRVDPRHKTPRRAPSHHALARSGARHPPHRRSGGGTETPPGGPLMRLPFFSTPRGPPKIAVFPKRTPPGT